MTPKLSSALGAVHAPSAVVNLSAIRHNVTAISARIPGKRMMGVVKGDAYGHGLIRSAETLVSCGIRSLGVATLDEAIALRAHGIPPEVSILAWLFTPSLNDPRIAAAIDAGIDLSAGSPEHLRCIDGIAQRLRQPARIHIEFDSGLGRGGIQSRSWPDFIRMAAGIQAAGTSVIVGLWTQLSYADSPEDERNTLQSDRFREAELRAREGGLRFETVHTSTSARALTRPVDELYGDTVRIGLSLFGVSPRAGIPASAWDLKPALAVQAPIAQVKWAKAGTHIGYDGNHRLQTDSYIGLIPLGYANGVPKSASGAATIIVAGKPRRIAGTVNMDQLMVELGADDIPVGTTATLLGTNGSATVDANDWGAAIHSYGDEIVVRFGGGVPRTYHS